MAGPFPRAQLNIFRFSFAVVVWDSGVVKIDLPDELAPVIIEALEHLDAYRISQRRENPQIQEAATLFRTKLPREPEEKPTRRRRK